MFTISNVTGTPGKNGILTKQHREIYETGKTRNPDLAAQRMEKHLQFVESEWREDIRRRRENKGLEAFAKTSKGRALIGR
jgi:DNA-binding FadR family transcriptional regulator